MDDEKKDDLTGILDYSKKVERDEIAKPADEAADFPESPVELVDSFESLDEFSKSNLTFPETTAETPQETQPEASPENSGETEFPVFEPGFTEDPQPESQPEFLTAPPEEIAPAEIAVEPEPTHPAEPPTSQQTLENVKNYSEHVAAGKPQVQAAFPFSLLIEGPLRPEEKERLIGLISSENMGVREVDLEPQFAAGKILIPRMSEYACVLLVQALRSSPAKLRFGPSDTIFSTSDTQDSSDSTRILPEDFGISDRTEVLADLE